MYLYHENLFLPRSAQAVARPGYSEHQTGLAADVSRADGACELKACFSQTAEGQWLATRAWDYGFILRYPEGKEMATGYEYEPWHIRYVGVELARAVRDSGQTLEEFARLP